MTHFMPIQTPMSLNATPALNRALQEVPSRKEVLDRIFLAFYNTEMERFNAYKLKS